MSIKRLAGLIKSVVDNRIDEESKAQRGIIHNDRLVSGGKSYPFEVAVNCNTGEGSRVWAQISRTGKAVVVGA